jgi:hypothetical protein
MDYKGYNIEPMRTFAMVEIKAKGQGFVPKDLDGMFSSALDAKRQIDMFLNSLKKGKSDGSSKVGSTG